ncbi:MAG: 4Fe-4S binding protein, partial [Kiloniellaceae bacterium]
MEIRGRHVLVCNCEQTMPLDAGKLAKACRAAGAEGEIELNGQLCRAQLGNFQQAILGERPVLVACTQEAPLFSEIAEEDNPAAEIAFTNIRERAGWSGEAEDATAKIAALLAEAALDIPPTPAVTLKSDGACLVYGADERAIEAAKQLAGRLDVTVLLREPGEILPPRIMDVPIFKGAIVQAKGHLGAFGVTVNDYAPAAPSSRAALVFEAPKDGAFSQCDLILDLSGGTPLFPAHEKRDGYLRPDPDDPVAVQKAIFQIADMVGEYEKPRYVLYDADICAHSRSRQTGCTRCLDVCPASAIRSAGDTVEIDAHVCAGCGACASVCPTGAATYQLPAGDTVFQRLRTLLGAYRAADGADPVLLVHDTRHGEEMVAVMARAGRGLPAHVLPFPLNEVTQIGLDFLVMALAYGAAQLCLLVDPRKAGELGGLAEQVGLAGTVMEGLGYGGGRIHILDDPDPEAVEAALYGLERRTPPPAGTFLPMGGKRARTMLALRHLHEHAPAKVNILPLPAGAPFGAVAVDVAGCTMCLACVGACPTGAMLDDPDRPWLGFNEEACVQCG